MVANVWVKNEVNISKFQPKQLRHHCLFQISKILLVLLVVFMNALSAQAPREMTYQGYLTDRSGEPIDGNHLLIFRIYDEAGRKLWEEEHHGIAIFNGIFTVVLGRGKPISKPLNLPFDVAYRMEIQLENHPPFQPRIRLTSGGYSHYSMVAENVKKISPNAITTVELADGAVTQSKLAKGVSLPLGGIAGGDLSGSYPNPVIKNGVITTAKLANGSITQSKLAKGVSLPLSGIAGGDLSGSYPNPVIKNGVITTAKLANGSITQAKLAKGVSLISSHLELAPAGRLDINNAKGLLCASFTHSTSGGGYLDIDAPDGSTAIKLTTGGAKGRESGYLSINTSNAREAVMLTTTGGNFQGGYIAVKAYDGSRAVTITTSGSGKNEHGWLSVRNGAGVSKAILTLNANWGGKLLTYTALGRRAVEISTIGRGLNQRGKISVKNAKGAETITLDGGNNQAGYIRMRNSIGAETITFDGNKGALYLKGNKSFMIDHPLQPDKSIVYACIEGPEVAAYTRGNAALVNGEAQVVFEEHFGLVVNSNTMTIQVTPHSAESQGLAVVERNNQGFKVKELNKGNGNYKFDYLVQGVRKGFENFQIVRSKMGINKQAQADQQVELKNMVASENLPVENQASKASR